MAKASKKTAIAKPAMAGPKVKRFDPMAHETDSWTIPAYLSDVENVGVGDAKVNELDPRAPVEFANAYLPSMVVELPMDQAGREIDTEYGYTIYSHGKVEPYSDNVTLAELKRRMITVEMSVRVLRWKYGWPEHMDPSDYPGADLVGPAQPLTAKPKDE